MASKRRRGDAFQYRIKHRRMLGARELTFTFQDETEGDAYIAQLEKLLDAGVMPEGIEPVSHVQHLDLAIREYRRNASLTEDDVKLLEIVRVSRWGSSPLNALNDDWAEAFVTHLKRDRNVSPGTVRKYAGALARCLDYCRRKGALAHNPLRALPRGYSVYTPADRAAVTATGGEQKTDESRDRRLQPGEEERIRAALVGQKRADRERALPVDPHLILLFDLALETAMRLREMLTLTVDQIDLGQRTIFLDRTKNGDRRQVPLSSVALAALRRALDGLPGDARLFPWWNGSLDSADLRRLTSALSSRWNTVARYAKCDDLRFHDLRHEATSRIFERTQLSDVEISRITGHRDPRMLRRYANLRGSNLAERLW